MKDNCSTNQLLCRIYIIYVRNAYVRICLCCKSLFLYLKVTYILQTNVKKC